MTVDRELGLVSGFSLEVVQGVARLCALMAFATARTTYRAFNGWTPSPRACFRMVDALGSEARPFLESSPPPDDDGSILIIQVDGKGAPMISEAEYERRRQAHEPRSKAEPERHRRRRRRKARPAKRRNKGEKSKNAKMAIVGIVYTLQPTAEGVYGPINKRVHLTPGVPPSAPRHAAPNRRHHPSPASSTATRARKRAASSRGVRGVASPLSSRWPRSCSTAL